MSELDKLEEYLKSRGERYERIDKEPDDFGYDKHQIFVLDENGKVKWDAICQKGSYGYDLGFLEIMGEIVNEEAVGDRVEGWLTASDVIERIETRYGRKYEKHQD